MKKCMKCGQKSGIQKRHKFCWNCGGNVFEETITRIVIGTVPIVTKKDIEAELEETPKDPKEV